jgi:hypothetical protein
MKKILIVIFLFLTLNVFSQKFELGIKSGAGVNLLMSKPGYEHKYIPSYTLTNSVHFNYKFSKLFFIRADITHDRLTNHSVQDLIFEEEIIPNPNGGVTINNDEVLTHILNVYDYLNLYVLPGFETNGKTKFYTYGGMYFGVKVNEFALVWNEGEAEKRKETLFRYKNDIVLNYGFAFGIGLKQTISKKLELSIENRLNLHDSFFQNVLIHRVSNNLTLGLSYNISKKK